MADEPALPELRARMLAREPEQIVYVARPGWRAIPSGTLTILGFVSPQLFSAGFLLWAIWWPEPATRHATIFAIAGTAGFAGLALLVAFALLRGRTQLAIGIARAPFIRLTVTDRRVLWTVPWSPTPLMEIGRERVIGGLLGAVGRNGVGGAALVLVPGDPSADIDGNIHFDRLPDAARFVDAVGRMA